MARNIFPATTKLIINDYGIVSNSSSTIQYLGLIRQLQTENLIDGIGVQAHAFSTNVTNATMIKNLDSLATTGLPVQVTEMDIDGPTDPTQLTNYQRIFPALWEHPGVEGITLWGWKPGLWRNDQAAYLIDLSGAERPALEWLRSYVQSTVDVKTGPSITSQFQLFNNYPNPFNPSTIIKYSVPMTAEISLKIFDMLGREVTTLVNEVKTSGTYEVTFNAYNLSSGVYFYQLRARDFVSTKKLLLIK
jgi:endo-1,4-beta-xylanase